MLPSLELIGGQLELWVHFQQFLGIGSKLGEVVPGLVVFVLPPKPLLIYYFLDARHGLDLLPVIAGQIEHQRNLVAHDQALCRLFAGLAVIEAPPDGDQERQEQERPPDAQDGQDTAALVAERILAHETGQSQDQPPGRESGQLAKTPPIPLSIADGCGPDNRVPSNPILAKRRSRYQWRSSLTWNDKCHPSHGTISVITDATQQKLRVA